MLSLLVFNFVPVLLVSFSIRQIRWNWLYLLVVWPGTVLHEICHFVLALLTNGQPSSFDVFPQKAPGGGYLLGSVQCSNIRWYNGAFIGMAPLLIMVGIWQWAPDQIRLDAHTLLYWAVSGLLFYSGIPSKTDFKVALKSIYPIAVIAALGAVIWFQYA